MRVARSARKPTNVQTTMLPIAGETKTTTRSSIRRPRIAGRFVLFIAGDHGATSNVLFELEPKRG